MSPTDRLAVARSNGLCFNCLFPGHRIQKCKKPSFCTVTGCTRKHSKFLHQQTDTSSNGSEPDPAPATDTAPAVGMVSHVSASSAGTSVCAYLPIVQVLINGKYPVYALLDSASTNTLISERLAAKLPPTNKRVRYEMHTINSNSDKVYKVLSINVSRMDGTECQNFGNVLVDDVIPFARPEGEIDLRKYPYLSDLPLSYVDRDVQVALLIGMDNGYAQIPLEVRKGSTSDLPYATRTLFGWSLCGPVPGVSNGPRKVYTHFLKLDKINEQVENLWNVETNLDDDVISWSHDDRRVIDLWNEQTEFVDGHYCLPIPWKGGEPCMPNNKWIAMTRLKNLTTRLKRTGLCEKYEHNLFDLVEKNYAEPVPTEELTLDDGSVWYLPHHNVTNKSKPDKFRIVFDCAAKYSGVSLNSECLQGPDLCNKLLHVLLRFRQFKLAITADIEAMYHQVKIPPKHRNCLRFLWEQNGCISEYRMTSHLFGGVWCSCSSTYALRQCVKDETCSNLVKATVNHAFYVDDMLKSVVSVDDGIDVIKGTKQVLAARGFNLTKFMTNDNNILREIPLDERAHETREITPELSSKALGMMWNVSDDVFYYVSKFHDDQVTPVTKRLMLSRVSSLYDPLGLIGPVVMLGKLLFQEAVRLKLSWDAEVPPTLSDRWTNWLQTLYDIHKLRFDRCVVPDGFQEAAIELHHFCDASLSGYGACSFLRLTNCNGRIHSALLMAKSRLAPVKQITVPRLELCAAVVAVKLDKVIRGELELELLPSTFWSDSQIVLSYIRNESKRFKIFEGNRVSFIRENTTSEQWQYIPGNLNPSDVASRGCTANMLPNDWYQGPLFLSDHKSAWPTFTSRVSDALCEDHEHIEVKHDSIVSPPVHQAAVNDVIVTDSSQPHPHPLDELINHYSSLYRLKKVLCWLVRVMHRLRDGMNESRNEPITVTEMRHAETVLIKHVQNTSFAREIRSITRGENVLKSSDIRALNPILFADILVVGGRLRHAPLSKDLRHPVILPLKHRLSDMILLEYHNGAHLGTEWTLSFVQNKY